MKIVFSRKELMSFIISIFMTIAFVTYGCQKTFSIMNLGILFLFYFIIKKYYFRKIPKSVIVVSIIFSLFFTLGRICYENTSSLNNVFELFFSFNTLVLYIGMYFFISLVLFLFLTYCKKIDLLGNTNFRSNKRLFLISFIVILLFWFIYFLNCYPGLIAPDSIYQIKQFKNIAILTDHHPVLHTFFIKFFYTIGSYLSISENFRVSIVTIAQMIIMSAIYSYFIVFLNKHKINKKVIILLILMFGLMPVYAFFSLSMWKDVLFGGFFLLFMINIYTLIEKKSKLKLCHYISFAILSLLILFFRNNALYMYFIIIPIFLYYFRKNVIEFIIMFSVVIISFYIIKYPVFNYIGIERSKSWEYLGMPIQQIGRMAYKEVNFTEKETERIEKFITVDNLKKDYNPRVSDGIKFSLNLNQEYFQNNNKEFLVLWKDLVIKNFDIAVESYLISTLGYWYPDLENNAVELGVTKNDIDIYNHSLLPKKISNFINGLYDYDTPILSWQWNIGIFIWLVVISALICIHKDRKKFLLCYIPILGLWLTLMLASPVNGMLRYVFWLYTSLPLLFLINYIKIED